MATIAAGGVICIALWGFGLYPWAIRDWALLSMLYMGLTTYLDGVDYDDFI
jgi:hypothetical protein